MPAAQEQPAVGALMGNYRRIAVRRDLHGSGTARAPREVRRIRETTGIGAGEYIVGINSNYNRPGVRVRTVGHGQIHRVIPRRLEHMRRHRACRRVLAA